MARTCRLGPTRPTARQGLAQQAARQQGDRFHQRYGRREADVLPPCWRDIRKDAAAGVDHVRAHAYEQHVDEHLHHLVARLQQQRDRAQRVRRHDLPTGDGPPRPLGIPAGEDPRLPLAVARLLDAIEEQDVRRGRDGDRPQGGALEAVDTRTITRPCGRYAWVVDADITQVCDTIDHAWMVRMLAARIADGALLRLLQQWLKAGVLDTDGQGLHPGTGTPQGGTVSPILAQVLWPDVLDLWVANVVKPHGRGEAGLSRDADACVCACEGQAEAARFYKVRGQRRATFGLELAAAKTRMLPVSRDRATGRTRFECLGVAFRWGQDRTGKDHLKRRTARKTLRTSLQRFTAWGTAHRHLRLPGRFQRLNAKRRGSDNDYGVHGNAASLKAFFNKAMRMLLKWLNRRSQRHRYTWPGDTDVLERFQVARPRIVGRPKTRQATLKTSADLRKRVLLKSPVRDNRTPGSVRGPSGHRRSYRDDGQPRRQRVRVYLDNVIASAPVRDDLASPEERRALKLIQERRNFGKLEIVTSRESWREQERTRNAQAREELRASRDKTPVVSKDHRVLGFNRH
jgi:RNA-directed DNA polymerase